MKGLPEQASEYKSQLYGKFSEDPARDLIWSTCPAGVENSK